MLTTPCIRCSPSTQQRRHSFPELPQQFRHCSRPDPCLRFQWKPASDAPAKGKLTLNTNQHRRPAESHASSAKITRNNHHSGRSTRCRTARVATRTAQTPISDPARSSTCHRCSCDQLSPNQPDPCQSTGIPDSPCRGNTATRSSVDPTKSG